MNRVELLDGSAIYELFVFSNSISYFADSDKFVCGMGAGGFAWPQFKGRKWHQSLVAKGRTTERLHSHGYTFLNKRMLRINTG